ncbi:MAG: hypothetical protein K0M58_00755 [Thiobacillus sp.]|nr:hypothetical protein [Thiobacillus sp.]
MKMRLHYFSAFTRAKKHFHTHIQGRRAGIEHYTGLLFRQIFHQQLAS